MKQNKDREELRKQIESLVTLYFGEPCIAVEDSLVDWIETHTQKKVKEAYKKGISDVEKNIEYNAQTKVWEIPEEKILSLNKGDK